MFTILPNSKSTLKIAKDLKMLPNLVTLIPALLEGFGRLTFARLQMRLIGLRRFSFLHSPY